MGEVRLRIVSDAVAIELARFDGFLFDLDGVITRTADLHALAWKKLFDEYLSARSARTGMRSAPFDVVTRAHVDETALGWRPRFSRIAGDLPHRRNTAGRREPGDGARLGKRKNRYFLALLEQEGVRVYGSAIRLVRQARSLGVRTAVVSSSRSTARLRSGARAPARVALHAGKRILRRPRRSPREGGGIELREGVLWLSPRLPKPVRRLRRFVRYRCRSLALELEKNMIRVQVMDGTRGPVRIAVNGETYEMAAPESRCFELR
jgi:hypothetical protein